MIKHSCEGKVISSLLFPFTIDKLAAAEKINCFTILNFQWKLLLQYHDANKLLITCLNSDCYVDRQVRPEIEDTLLLPVTWNE
ncbi:hypothetical protein G7B40_037270 [Aetokthonos hydrillicola Thurmond2011]|uniref:NACHT conflict system C-terminal helical domain-containing protein n=1 Tax=Aetokthonos hydrillicola Thurmond2011 TaxID=2712845 RepID=A0AAP5IEF4_9CYAN|nr:hypothetical protein [Aetokthonos hydrillicola]MBO3457223.1 hypothetical protein [Aetokthonos hydrillicola CCALA 1050]MBW4587573.1 hypothetical protein [Aetokthonos hydrillicola CCALA 1050]MDR9900161.1 hypothetical protein [Aetokthonos hydrillicola Thurmond2011]